MKCNKIHIIPVVLLAIFVVTGLTYSFLHNNRMISANQPVPQPVEGEENEKLRERYNELRHTAAPGVVWQKMEANNASLLFDRYLKRSINQAGIFANGAIEGEWMEKGANNQTGSVRAIDYEPGTNMLYNISNGGSIWTSVLGSGLWTIRNQSKKFEPRTIKAFTKTGGGVRILVASGEAVFYSDDNGITLTASTGFSFPVAWAGNHISQFIQLNDAGKTIYCLTRPWSASPWGPRYWLYRSTNQGVSYSKIFEFESGNENQVSLCNPYNTNNLYAADIAVEQGKIRLYRISGSTVTVLNNSPVNTTINNQCLLKGTSNNGDITLYVMINNNSLYASTNLGSTWKFRSSFPENAWNKMNVNPSDPDKLAYGGVNAYRSNDGGASWTKVNNWSEYYSNISSRLHADIMEIEYFKKNNNTAFAIVNTHGGTFTSYDDLLTVHNQSLTTHLATEYYDVLTDTINAGRIFAATQDQGLQATLTGNSPGLQDFNQIISGDYGHLCLSSSNRFLWAQYIGGTFYLYNNLGNSWPTYIGSWMMAGTQKPNYGWMLPSIASSNFSANEIFVGGGNIHGGEGSYLTRLTMDTAPPYTVSASQYDYNFRANSRTGNAGITAIEQSYLNPNKLFIATEDGTFFYTNNHGVSWNKTTTFTGPGPWYLYGACILNSRINDKVVWYGGSGYSNPPVFKSTDGGASFLPMSDGLPSTLVNEIIAVPGEAFLFAATEAGPYVYVTAENKWHPLSAANTPIQFFSSVEYIPSENTVRFGTMGRGIWDFRLLATTITYTFTGNGNWDNPANWFNNMMPSGTLLPGSEIIINPPGNGECVLNVELRLNSNTKMKVMPGKKFRVTGSLNIANSQ